MGIKEEGGIKKDTREDSKGRTVSKRKIRELVESVDPEERLDDEVEDVSQRVVVDIVELVLMRIGCSCCSILPTSLSIQSRGSRVNSRNIEALIGSK